MRTAYLRERPTCDICGEREAEYDDKIYRGPWAYMCEVCHKKYGAGIGSRLMKEGSKNKDKIAELMLDIFSDQYTCPHCKATMSIEPDGEGLYHCLACGGGVKIIRV